MYVPVGMGKLFFGIWIRTADKRESCLVATDMWQLICGSIGLGKLTFGTWIGTAAKWKAALWQHIFGNWQVESCLVATDLRQLTSGKLPCGNRFVAAYKWKAALWQQICGSLQVEKQACGPAYPSGKKRVWPQFCVLCVCECVWVGRARARTLPNCILCAQLCNLYSARPTAPNSKMLRAEIPPHRRENWLFSLFLSLTLFLSFCLSISLLLSLIFFLSIFNLFLSLTGLVIGRNSLTNRMSTIMKEARSTVMKNLQHLELFKPQIMHSNSVSTFILNGW